MIFITANKDKLYCRNNGKTNLRNTSLKRVEKGTR